MTTRKRTQKTTVAALGMLFSLNFAGCGGEGISAEEDVGTVQSPLYMSDIRWPQDPTHGGTGIGADLHICFDRTAVSNTALPAAIQTVVQVIEWGRATWGAVADIKFFYEGECVGSGNGKLKIVLDDNGGTRCDPYGGPSTPSIFNLKFSSVTKTIAVHELGHALGFYHEFARHDWAFGSNLGVECNTDSDCIPDMGNYGPICTAVIVSDGQTKRRCTNAPDKGVKLSANADYHSIMASTYVNNEANTTGNLSPLDISGVQAVYGVKPELTWTAWQAMAEASTLPVGAAGFDGAMHAFAIESGGVIGHNATLAGNSLAPWTHEVDGTTNASIAAATFGNDLHLFLKGASNGRVYHRSAPKGQAFGAWTNEISGTTNLPLTAATLGNSLHLFRVDTNNNLLHASASTGQAFGAWEPIDGSTNTAVAATALGNSLHVFMKGAGNGHAYHRSVQNGQAFGAWEDLRGVTSVAPATVTVGPGAAGGNDRILMLVVGTDNHIYYRLAQDGFGFGGWLEIPGGVTTTVSVGAARLGANAYVFATGTDGQVRFSKAFL